LGRDRGVALRQRRGGGDQTREDGELASDVGAGEVVPGVGLLRRWSWSVVDHGGMTHDARCNQVKGGIPGVAVGRE
jgi:hypothetical protein